MTRRDGRRLFCLGFGYCAEALARHLSVAEWYVGGTARGSEKVRQLSEKGLDAVLWDGGPPSELLSQKLLDATHILVSVPPDEHGDPAFAATADIIRGAAHLQWLGYLSTTGVYGDTEGKAVDETAPVNPSGERGRRRVEAEKEWLSLLADNNVPSHVFRLPGIYGPDRSVFDQIRRRQAKRIDRPGHAFSRIHVDDVALVVAASMHQPAPGEIYNVCDDEAAPPAEVTEYACNLMGVEPPPVEDFEIAKLRMSPMALSFWNDNRRISNRKIHETLGVTLRHPDYRSGLQAIFLEED